MFKILFITDLFIPSFVPPVLQAETLADGLVLLANLIDFII